MKAYTLTLHPVHTVRKAIIPVAGFGTRLYPATRSLKKDFFPIPCSDGMVRPVILILLEELVKSGVEEICLVLGSEEERIQYTEFFERPLSDDHLSKLNKEAQEYENRILDIGKRLHYVYQREKRGSDMRYSRLLSLPTTSPYCCCWVTRFTVASRTNPVPCS